MNPEIIREYDIRGIAGVDITDEDVLLLGKAIGTYLIRKDCLNLCVGRDCRLTSDFYAIKLIEGLISTGCNVINIGICPSPVLYFSIWHLKQQGGVMVTASHNPKEYNGFKLCIGDESIHGEEIKKIFNIVQKNDFVSGKGFVKEQNIINDYQNFILNNIKISKPLRIAIDAGNGTGGFVAIPLLKSLKCEVHDLFCDMDGNFPNHDSDPSVLKNMRELISLVKEKKLDLGIGYDGDGDRIGVIDEKGNMIYSDMIVILFAREILSRKPGSTFIGEVKCSKKMYDDIEKHGGKAIMWKTGHSLIKDKMKREKAELAGEMSGHIFFADRYLGYDDAIYSSCRLIELISNSGKSISELLSDIPQTYSTPEIRVDCPDDKKFLIVEQLSKIFKKNYNVIDIDGIRLLFEDGWGLIRASNTQPSLVMRFEAFSKDRLDEIKKLVEDNLQKIKAIF
ncbi:MAG: phosphomannomutase/phosphoglucomutase [Desulfobacterales bacterium]|nr:phosphomannomutase/phosphoglucomutase [Desulfobacterales bacterium]